MMSCVMYYNNTCARVRDTWKQIMKIIILGWRAVPLTGGAPVLYTQDSIYSIYYIVLV